MASFAPIRDTRTNIENTPIVDGQILFETDMGSANKIYIDNGSTRVQIGGSGAHYLDDLDDVQLVGTPNNKEILQYDGNDWTNANALDEWYNTTQTALAGDTDVTFTISKTITSSVAFDPYCEVDLGAELPTIKSIVISENSLDNTKDDIVITFSSAITAQQAGANDDKCIIKLRMIK